MTDKDNTVLNDGLTDEMDDESPDLPFDEPDNANINPYFDGPDDISIDCLLHDMGAERHTRARFRDEILREICAILISETKPNALLIGPAGAGKTNVVEELAWRIRNGHRDIPKKLRDSTVYSISLSDIVSGSGLVGDLERKVRRLVDHLESEEHKAILFLDEVHILFGGESYKKVAQMLKPALSRGRFMVIAATTTQEVKLVENDPAFNRRFTRVLVDELTREQTEQVLESAVQGMEAHYGVKIGFNSSAARLLVRTADEFCGVGSHRPDNALTLMDRAVAARVIASGAGPDDTIMLDEKLVTDTAFRLTSGNSTIKEFDAAAFRAALGRIRGQDDILDDITRAIRLYDLHLRPHDRPLTFLFAGPSGVGKSETAKLIASEYIGDKPIVLNMAEYDSPAAVNRLIGAPTGYIGSDSNRELPFDVLDTNPWKVILLDEFEKCDQTVRRLFMSVFDEGVMVTNFGKKIDFSKTIIIATTNAGCTEKTGCIGFGAGERRLSVSDLTAYFEPELINRFSHIYTFHSISETVYAQILRACMESEVRGLRLDRVSRDAAMRIRAAATEEAVALLCARSYNSKLGARPARTAVREYLDDLVLSYMERRQRRPEKSAARRRAVRTARFPSAEAAR